MEQSIFDAAGGMDAMRSIARCWHDLAVSDPVVSHAFSHGYAADHEERLASYLAQALGGPSAYTESYGEPAQMDRLHAGNGIHEDFDEAGIAVFARVVAQAGIPDPAATSIVEYWSWMTREVLNRHPRTADDVPADVPLHRWSWEGPSPTGA
ncbi:globin domain-containing protein [Brachybacterium tyrofermentans]|uniref:globin domain-containing protein n=1 Tax=Brachybacterium tyrofermentans TaxID=47848 RepID=UPI003F8E2E0E